ncbi:MAG TPA: PKD domain-containing protein, partial [Methanomicrobiales archaeon]|nr:PKD domain-containing protein [Methanomicrobiales archaeon]
TCYDHRPYLNSTDYTDFENQTFASEYQWVRELGADDRDYEYIRDNSFMGEQGGGFLWPGTSNAINGYLLYEVPRNLTPANTTISIWFNNVSQSSWVLQTARTAASGPLFPSFSASLPSGPWPLPEHFTDTTLGSPTSWSWDFGDNETSTEESPFHVYWYPASYTVALTVRNVHGSNTTAVKNGVVVLGGTPRNSTHAVAFRTDRPGYIGDGSYLAFVNAGLPGKIHLNGTTRDLPSPSLIGLLFSGNGDGEIGIRGNRFENLTYGNLTLFVNGSAVDRGMADGILVPECSNLSTAFTYSLPVSDGGVYLSWDDRVVLDGGDHSAFTIRGLGPDEGGSLTVRVGANRTVIAGNASEYQMPDLTIGGV